MHVAARACAPAPLGRGRHALHATFVVLDGFRRGQLACGLRDAVRACACLALLLPAACGGGNLAEAGGQRLTVEEAAQLIQDHSTIPGDSQVVRAVAELWVDYTLLAQRLEDDTSLVSLDVDELVRGAMEEEMLARLSDEVIVADTVVGDEELAERFAAEMPGAQATASQILLLFPPGATSRQRDSVRAAADGLRDRIEAGADFAALAERFSADRGSAARGGSMGTFERGQMLAAVDSAVFRLTPGETSEPVATELGYHLLLLERLEVPNLAEAGAEFRQRIQRERVGEAEAAYVALLDSASGLAFADDGLTLARALAETTPARLSDRAARRPLLTWAGGAYTVRDFLDLIRFSPGGAEGVADATGPELEAALLRVARRELLLTEARARDLEPTPARVDSARASARAAVLARAREVGLASAAPAPEAGLEAAAEQEAAVAPEVGSASAAPAAPLPATASERVGAVLVRVLSGEQQVLPLGPVVLLLRDQGSWRIHETRTGDVLMAIEELRSVAAGGGSP